MQQTVRLLDALKGYFADTDDPTPGGATTGDPVLPSRDNERMLRLFARLHREEAQLIQDLRQRVAALEAQTP